MQLSKVIKKPIITEKSMKLLESNKYTFEVNLKATKNAVANEVKKLFGVDSLAVKTTIIPGKKKRIAKTFRFKKTPMKKKAIVTIKEGQSIDLFPKE